MQRILVVKLADLGDLLTATPALRAIRNAHPAAHVTALVAPATAELLRGSTAVDETILFDKRRFDTAGGALLGIRSALRLRSRVRGGGWDAMLLCHHLTTLSGVAKYAALCAATGAPIRAGLDNGRGWFLTHRVADGGFGAKHEVDYWLDVAALIGGVNERPRLEIAVSDADAAWADRVLLERGLTGAALLVVHPGSGGFSVARRWPADRFATVADTLAHRHGLRILALQGPATAERALAERVASSARGEVEIVGPAPTPGALAALLARAALFIGNDSGVVHIASAVGAPTVAVFGPSNAAAWGPYPPTLATHEVVRERVACSPCVYRGHSLGTPQGCPARTCLDIVEPSAVVAAAERVLAAASGAEARATRLSGAAPT